jgi:hypothetical protein
MKDLDAVKITRRIQKLNDQARELAALLLDHPNDENTISQADEPGNDPITNNRVVIRDFLREYYYAQTTDTLFPTGKLALHAPAYSDLRETNLPPSPEGNDPDPMHPFDKELCNTRIGKLLLFVHEGTRMAHKDNMAVSAVAGENPDAENMREIIDPIFRENVEQACYIVVNYLKPSYAVPSLFWTSKIGGMVRDALIFSRGDRLITMTEAAERKVKRDVKGEAIGTSIPYISKLVDDNAIYGVPDIEEKNPRKRMRVFMREIDDYDSIIRTKRDCSLNRDSIINTILNLTEGGNFND